MAELTMPLSAREYDLGDAKVYTMRQLNQNCAAVIAEINRDGRPAAITKHGRFVAMITPLEDAKIESLVLSRAPFAADLVREPDEEVRTHSSGDVAADLGLDLGPRP